MVDLHTVKRVLALDLGMGEAAIETLLAEHWPERSRDLSLDEALQLVAAAESLAASR